MSIIDTFFAFTKKNKFNIPTSNQLTYKGELECPEEDELRYFKESFNIPENINIKVLQYAPCGQSVFKIDNIVIKALISDFDESTNTTKSTFESAIKTCELTKKAYLCNVGVKYFTNVIVSNKYHIVKRIYLFTEYLPIINPNYNKECIKEFAEKISNSKLLYHPDFWYKNICVTTSNELRAIDWGGIPEDIKNITKIRSLNMMMNSYNTE